jgi:chaperonin GroES
MKHLIPVGHRIIVKPDPVKEKTESGLFLAVDKKMEQNAQVAGTIVSIGPDAWAAFRPSIPFAGLKIGDRVYYAKYAGKWIENPETKENLLVLNDEDIVAKDWDDNSRMET